MSVSRSASRLISGRIIVIRAARPHPRQDTGWLVVMNFYYLYNYPMLMSQRRQQNRSAAIRNYYLLKNNLMIAGLQARVSGTRVILSNGTTPLLEISAGGIRSYDPAFYDAARTLSIQLTLAMYGQGATLAVRGSWGDRRAYRRAGFNVINDSVPARLGRFVLSLA